MMKLGYGILVLLGASLVSCNSVTGKRYFNVSSFPTGATIFVEGEPRGQTDEQRLEVDFPQEETLITLRLEKEGYQTTGIVLNPRTQMKLVFFMQESPNNRKMLEVLNNLQRTLGQMGAQMDRATSEKSQ